MENTNSDARAVYYYLLAVKCERLDVTIAFSPTWQQIVDYIIQVVRTMSTICTACFLYDRCIKQDLGS
jgi:hypothetical protein